MLDGANGEPCTAPCTRELSEGSHTAAAVLPGYQTGFQQFEVIGPGGEVTVSLKQITGLLQVESDPGGALVSIDGKPYVRPTPTTLELPPGEYTLTLQKQGFQTVQTKITIQANGFGKQTFQLAAQ